jgi:hypothetical protein
MRKLDALVRTVQTLHSELAEARQMVLQAKESVHKVELELQSNVAVLEELTGNVISLPSNGSRATVASDERGVDGASLRGQAAVARWITVGVLVSSSSFADAWGITRQALEQAVARGELFSIKHGNKRFYPRPLLSLDRQAVAMVCKALGRADGVEKLIFWQRTQGGLRGQSAVQAVAAGQVERVAQLAYDWAEENGLADAVATA